MRQEGRCCASGTGLVHRFAFAQFACVLACVFVRYHLKSVCGDLTAVVRYESVGIRARAPPPVRHCAQRTNPFASAAQQQAPAPRGPILSELASVNGRGGGVLLEQGAPKLQKQKTPPRRGGAPGGKLNTAAFALAPADITFNLV